MGVFVAEIASKGAAAREGKLLLGDQIACVAGEDLTGASSQQVSDALKRAPSPIHLVVLRVEERSGQRRPHVITLTKSPGEPLGIWLIERRQQENPLGTGVADGRNESVRTVTPPPPYEMSRQHQQKPSTFIGLSILSVFFCLCCGIAAIMDSMKVSSLWHQGRYEAARRASKRALGLAISGIIIGVILTTIMIVYDEVFRSESYLGHRQLMVGFV